MHLCHSIHKRFWMDSFMLSISFAQLFLLRLRFGRCPQIKETMKYRFVHGIMENQWVLGMGYRLFNFYANCVISFKIFELSNFKHEFCMSHIILWQRQQHRRHRQKNKFQLFSADWNTRKKCVCVECAFFEAVAFKIHLNWPADSLVGCCFRLSRILTTKIPKHAPWNWK